VIPGCANFVLDVLLYVHICILKGLPTFIEITFRMDEITLIYCLQFIGQPFVFMVIMPEKLMLFVLLMIWPSYVYIIRLSYLAYQQICRLPKSVLELSKKMLNGFSRNPVAATAEREAGWLLLASLLASMPKEVLQKMSLCLMQRNCYEAYLVMILFYGMYAGAGRSGV
jgi:hypothetical protein